MGFRSERWHIRPLELPRPWRYCTTCTTASAFLCSERFRVNANKKSLDVWLKYRCTGCEETWKLPLFERCPVSALGAAQLDGFTRHDPAAVWMYAFDLARLKPHVIRMDTDVRVQVERASSACECATPQHACVHFEVPFRCDVRLDRLLANELAISRSKLKSIVAPEYHGALNKRVRDEMRITLHQSLSRRSDFSPTSKQESD